MSAAVCFEIAMQTGGDAIAARTSSNSRWSLAAALTVSRLSGGWSYLDFTLEIGTPPVEAKKGQIFVGANGTHPPTNGRLDLTRVFTLHAQGRPQKGG